MTRGNRNLTPNLRGVGSDAYTIGFESSVAVEENASRSEQPESAKQDFIRYIFGIEIGATGRFSEVPFHDIVWVATAVSFAVAREAVVFEWALNRG